MIITFLDIVIAVLLMGGIYALIAVGLSLQYGVARVLNISHGEFIRIVSEGKSRKLLQDDHIKKAYLGL